MSSKGGIFPDKRFESKLSDTKYRKFANDLGNEPDMALTPKDRERRLVNLSRSSGNCPRTAVNLALKETSEEAAPIPCKECSFVESRFKSCNFLALPMFSKLNVIGLEYSQRTFSPGR